MFLCQQCHWESACRSEVHLNISRGRCEKCGFTMDCFDCTTKPPAATRMSIVQWLIKIYRNTKPIEYKRKPRSSE